MTIQKPQGRFGFLTAFDDGIIACLLGVCEGQFSAAFSLECS